MQQIPLFMLLFPASGQGAKGQRGDAVVYGNQENNGRNNDKGPNRNGDKHGRKARKLPVKQSFGREKHQTEAVPDRHHSAECSRKQ